MSIESLFLNKMNENIVYKKMSDPSTWEEEILGEFYKNITGSEKKIVRLEIKQKNESKGYLLGSLVILDTNSKKQASIPIIIKGFHLAPLDIFIVDGKALPLTNDNFDSYFFNHKIFNKTVRPKPLIGPAETISSFENAYPSYSLFKAASEFGFLKNDVEHFKESLSKEAFLKIATTNVGAKILDLINKNEIENPRLEKYVDEYADKSQMYMFEKLAYNRVKCFSCPEEYWKPIEKDITIDKQADLQESLTAQGFDPSKVKQIDSSDTPDRGDNLVEIKEADSFAKYKVMRGDGKEILGSVIPNVIDFNQKKQNMKIFVSETNSAFTENIHGMKMDDLGSLPEGNLVAGKFGTFVYQEDGNAIATIPFTIASLTKENNEVRMKIYDYKGNPKIVKIVPEVKKIMSTGEGVVYIPGDMEFVELPGVIKLADKYNMNKIAEANTLSINSIHIIGKGNDRFVFRGLDKYAEEANWNFSDLDRNKAKFVLMNLGNTEKTAELILDDATNKEHISFNPENIKPTRTEYLEKMSQKWDKKVNPYLSIINSLKTNLSKEASNIIVTEVKHPFMNLFFEKNAAEINGEDTVDAVLGLNFLNPDNIEIFKNFSPVLENAASKLCQLTIATRLGLTQLKEEDTVKAFKAIDRVLNGLKKV